MKKKRICFLGLLLVILHTFCGCKNNSMFEKLVRVSSSLFLKTSWKHPC